MSTATEDGPKAPGPRSAAARRRGLWAFALLAAVAGVAGGGWWFLRRPNPPPPPEVPREAADPEVAAALAAARARVVDEPRSAGAWGGLGMALVAHRFEADAAVCFEQAEALDPKDQRWPYYRALLAWFADPPEALRHLRRAAPRKPPSAEHGAAAALRLAEALLAGQAWDEAEAIFRRELTRAPHDPRANYGLGLVALARGESERGQRHFQVAANSPLTRKRAKAQLAAVSRQLGDTEAAARLEREARALPEDPAWPDPYVRDYKALERGFEARFARVRSLREEGQAEDAARVAVDLAESVPGPRAYLMAATALAETGDYPRAERYLQLCLERDPEHAEAHHFLALVLFVQAENDKEPQGRRAQARFQESARHARLCLDRQPDDGVMYLYLGKALVTTGEPGEAVRQLRLAVASSPDRAEAHAALAEALWKTGAKQEAQKSARVARGLAGPDDAKVQEVLRRLEE